MESSYISAYVFLLILVLLSFVSVIFLLYKSQKLQRRFSLTEDTLKQWQSNFNELRGMCDALARNIDAMNERVNTAVKYGEDNVGLAERVEQLEEDARQLFSAMDSADD